MKYFLILLFLLTGSVMAQGFIPDSPFQTTDTAHPVLHGFKVAENGTVTDDDGDIVNGDCSNASPQICTLNADKFSKTPNCNVQARAYDYKCGIGSEGVLTLGFKCKDGATDGTLSIKKSVTCFGVK